MCAPYDEPAHPTSARAAGPSTGLGKVLVSATHDTTVTTGQAGAQPLRGSVRGLGVTVAGSPRCAAGIAAEAAAAVRGASMPDQDGHSTSMPRDGPAPGSHDTIKISVLRRHRCAGERHRLRPRRSAGHCTRRCSDINANGGINGRKIDRLRADRPHEHSAARPATETSPRTTMSSSSPGSSSPTQCCVVDARHRGGRAEMTPQRLERARRAITWTPTPTSRSRSSRPSTMPR